MVDAETIFGEFLKRFLRALATRVAGRWDDQASLLAEAAQDFVFESRSDLERWTGLLAAGGLSRRDFDWLVRAQADLLKTHALTRAGMGRGQIDRFRALMVETIVTTAIELFLRRR